MNLIRPPKTEASLCHPLEQPLARRRSVRAYADRPVSLTKLSCLLWAAQGVTHPKGPRTALAAALRRSTKRAASKWKVHSTGMTRAR